jgi:hypothetical protein
MNHLRQAALLLALAAGAVACGPSVTLQTPSGFAVLEDQKEYVYRATSAEGVVLGVRAEKNEPRGNIDFWTDALDRQLRRAGYVAEGDMKEVHTRTGLTGREVKYTRVESGRKYRFWMTVFVTDKRVWVVEVGGDADRFKEKMQLGVQQAIESIGVG